MYLTKEEIVKKGLTTRLSSNGFTYLAYVAHPRGGTTVMEAHRVVKEYPGGYRLEEASETEMQNLERKHARGNGSSFTITGRINQKV